MSDFKERLGNIGHTLHHVGIFSDEFSQVAREAKLSGRQLADELRPKARDNVWNMGVNPDGYIEEGAIDIEVIEPPLPEPILRALGNLGTSESRLLELEPLIH